MYSNALFFMSTLNNLVPTIMSRVKQRLEMHCKTRQSFHIVCYPECITDLDLQSEMIILESLLTTA